MPPASDRPWYRPAPAAALRADPDLAPHGAVRRRWGERLRALPRVRRFFAVGVGGIVVNNLALAGLHGWVGLALLPATLVAVELAVVHNYVLHEMWTFRRMRLSAR